MLGVRVQHNINEHWHERICGRVGLGVLEQTCPALTHIAVTKIERCYTPKMTLQQFRTQIILSLGALYDLILRSSYDVLVAMVAGS